MRICLKKSIRRFLIIRPPATSGAKNPIPLRFANLRQRLQWLTMFSFLLYNPQPACLQADGYLYNEPLAK